MLFEATPEESARRVAEALLAAELGENDAWRWLSEPALQRLRADSDVLAALVPVAFIRLAEQLASHPRSGVRIDAVRYALLAWQRSPADAEALLYRLSEDGSRGVQRAARLALGFEDAMAGVQAASPGA